MTPLMTMILAVQLLCALVMIGLILVQQGKGADAGAAFGGGGGGGGGSAGSLFGASGSANFMSRATAVLATVFFVCTLGLAYLSNVTPASIGSVLEGAVAPTPAQQIPGGASGAAGSDVPAPAGSGAGSVPNSGSPSGNPSGNAAGGAAGNAAAAGTGTAQGADVPAQGGASGDASAPSPSPAAPGAAGQIPSN